MILPAYTTKEGQRRREREDVVPLYCFFFSATDLGNEDEALWQGRCEGLALPTIAPPKGEARRGESHDATVDMCSALVREIGGVLRGDEVSV